MIFKTFDSKKKTPESTNDFSIPEIDASDILSEIPTPQKILTQIGKKILQAVGAVVNMFVTWALNKVIDKAIAALDNYIHRLDKAKEALSNTQSEISSIETEIESLNDKIKELENRDPASLSIINKEDLQNLKAQNEELKIRQQYLNQEKNDDQQKVANLTKEKYNQQYGTSNQELIEQYKSLYENQPGPSKPVSSYLTGENTTQTISYAASSQDTGLIRGSGVLADLIAQYEYYSDLKKIPLEMMTLNLLKNIIIN